RRAPRPGGAAPRPVCGEGPHRGAHPRPLVNPHLCQQPAGRGHELSLWPVEFSAEVGVPQVAAPPAMAARVRHRLSRPPLAHIRHQWPPNWTPPAEGHWVVMQPWEFGSLPRAWVEPLVALADEVWAYSRFVRDCYVHSGVPAERVHLIPLGVDTDRFRPGLPPLPLRTAKPLKFLFVGGTIARKGIDVLLTAYAQAFTAADPVCLVGKDMGNGTFYQGQTAEQLIAHLQAREGAPAIEYLDGNLTEEELAGLYAACDCLVHPYRGEGFGLPIAEALACGLPVIVTGSGAALDFCDAANAYLVPARVVPCPHKRVGEWETVDSPWLAGPDPVALRDLLRHVAAHPEEARAKGRAGRERIASNFTWDKAAAAVEARLRALRCMPVRRFQAAPGPSALPASDGGRRPRVSLCMIVRNEEANLPACLALVRDLVDEMGVGDTGSTGGTKEGAAGLGATLGASAWCDDFAAARNESLRHATGEWIFWLDGDESLDADNRQKVRALFAALPAGNVAFVMRQRSPLEAAPHALVDVDQVRLFRNHPAIRWQGRVHEQILPSVRRQGGTPRHTGFAIAHRAFVAPAVQAPKVERTPRLLELEAQERPDDPSVHFNRGSIAFTNAQPAAALAYYRRSLELSQPGDTLVPKL